MEYLGHYVVAAGLFVAIDAVWLTIMSKRFYKPQPGKLVADKPKLGIAAIFYALYIIGVLVFAVEPALAKDSLGCAAAAGALLGLLMYATYDLTNHSTLKNWPAKVTVVDMIWGTFVTSVVATLTFLIFA